MGHRGTWRYCGRERISLWMNLFRAHFLRELDIAIKGELNRLSHRSDAFLGEWGKVALKC